MGEQIQVVKMAACDQPSNSRYCQGSQRSGLFKLAPSLCRRLALLHVVVSTPAAALLDRASALDGVTAWLRPVSFPICFVGTSKGIPRVGPAHHAHTITVRLPNRLQKCTRHASLTLQFTAICTLLITIASRFVLLYPGSTEPIYNKGGFRAQSRRQTISVL